MSRHNNQYCVNPETNRNIRIGGKVWMKLVKTNKIDEGDYKHPNVGYQTEETYEDANDAVLRQLEEQKQYMIDNNQVPPGKVLHMKPPRKGFRSKGKIVYRDRNLTAREASKSTAGAAMDVIDQIQNGEIEVPADMNRDEAHEYLQGLIFNKMLSVGTKFKNMKLQPKNIKPKKMPAKTKKYKTIAPKKKKKSVRMMIPKKVQRPVISERNDNIVYEDYDPDETEYETEQDSCYPEDSQPEYEDDTEVEYVYE